MSHSLSVCSSFIAATLGHALIPIPRALESRVSRKHWKTQEEQIAADTTPHMVVQAMLCYGLQVSPSE